MQRLAKYHSNNSLPSRSQTAIGALPTVIGLTMYILLNINAYFLYKTYY